MTNDEELLDGKRPEDIATFWKRAIESEKKRHKKWRDQAKEAQDAYDEEAAFNIMWPSIQITKGALYSSTPDPEVRRRQRDGDDLQKQAAQIMERAISFCIDNHDFDGNAEQALGDFVVSGMGQGKVSYKPEFSKRALTDPSSGILEFQEYISAQCTALEHFSWKHFGWQPCKRWENVDWVYFEHQKRRKEVREEYEVDPSEEVDSEDSDNKHVKVWEIWHKPARARIYIAEQFNKPLSIARDELGLRSFFPCPRPMFANLATDTLLPAPDFKYIKTQFTNLKRVSKRLKGLSESIKAAGYYDTSFTELAKLQKARDGQYIPVDQLLAKLQDTNLDSVIAEMPINHKIAVAAYLVEEKQRLIDEVYEILGISDIMRGETNAQEGVETQQLKSEFGAIRIRDKQREVNRFCRDVFRIMGEVIAEHFEPEILEKITGIEIAPEVMAILRNDFLRNVSVDIETDSTNAGDKIRHRQEANETLQTVTSGLMEILGAMANGLPKPVGQELCLMLVRSVEGNTGNLEDILSRMGDEGSPEALLQQLQGQLQQLSQENQMLKGELQKVDQADTAKKMASAQLDNARTQEIVTKLPGEQAQQQADVEQTRVETSGKRVEQAANLHTAMQPREPFLRGIE